MRCMASNSIRSVTPIITASTPQYGQSGGLAVVDPVHDIRGFIDLEAVKTATKHRRFVLRVAAVIQRVPAPRNGGLPIAVVRFAVASPDAVCAMIPAEA